MSPIRTVIAGVALVAATTFGGAAALAATPSTGSDLKADVTQGQAEVANDQAGTNEVGEVADVEVNTAGEADDNGDNQQLGEQVETGEQSTANEGSTQDPSSAAANERGSSGEAAK
jgi:hypothetical protein